MYRVLLVDDCRADVNGIKDNINWKNLNCEIAACAFDGQDGVNKALEYKPDIIITDVSMPILDGIEMTKILRSKMETAYFIFISCFEDFSYIKSAMDEEAVAYVLKPVKIDELTRAVEKAITKLENRKKYESGKTAANKEPKPILENFFTELLLNFNIDKSYAEYVGISEDDVFNMAVLKINDSSYSAHNMHKILHSVKKIGEKFFHGEKYCLLEFGLNTLVFISWDISIDSAEYNLILENIKSEAVKECGDIFAMTSGQTFCGFSELSNRFNMLNMIRQPSVSEHEHRQDISVRDLYNRISRALFDEKVGQSGDLTDEIFADDGANDINYLKAICIQVINVINIILFEEYDKNFYEIVGDELVIWNDLIHLDSAENIKRWMNDMLAKLRSYFLLQTNNADRYEALVDKVCKYIDENYHSYTVIDEIARKLNLSVGYINMIFKKNKKQTLFSYTVNKRIEKSKELLKDDTLSVSKISRMVGYSSNAYFATAFKKTVGVTPMQYRNRILGIN